MKLAAFQVANYKSIEDSTRVTVHPRVTALVGKNESGKSAILDALWKSRNNARVHFDRLYDYPRGLAHVKKTPRSEVLLEFDLSEHEIAEIESQMPDLLSNRPRKIFYRSDFTTSSQNYRLDTPFVTISVDEVERIIKHVIKETDKCLEKEISAGIHAAADSVVDEIQKTEVLWDASTIAVLRSLVASVASVFEGDEIPEQLSTPMELVNHLIEVGVIGDPNRVVEKWARNNVPEFIYFGDYSELDSRIHLPSHLRADNSEPRTRTRAVLFDRIGMDPSELLRFGQVGQHDTREDIQRRIEERKVFLEDMSRDITSDWNRWWGEGQHSLHLEIDGEDMSMKVSDDYISEHVPFEKRSHGFRWFFSFYLVFLSESEKLHKNAILLLDEPGLHLHPTLQSKLLAFFERLSDDNQIIYTTHMPFMIDGDHIERVRTVYLTKQKPRRTRVSNNVRPEGDRDTLLPLQLAVGYSIAQTLFLGKRSLIVEGVTDYWYIKTLNACLSRLEVDAVLNSDIVLIPAGGISNLMPLASVMFASSNADGRFLSVLLDSDKQGMQASTKVAECFGSELSFILLGQAIGMKEATIEDLVPRDDYVEAVKDAVHSPFSLNDVEKERVATNVRAVDAAFRREGVGRFEVKDKAAVALVIIDKWSSNPSSVPIITRERARSLFEAINRQFDTLESA